MPKRPRRVDDWGDPEEEYFEVRAVADLPQPEPFRTKCMGDKFTGRARRFGFLSKPCCWYHDRDWAAINEHAIRLLGEARADGCEYASQTHDFVYEHWRPIPLRRQDRSALLSLFGLHDPISIGPSNIYTNGQHRAQAMMDLGIERTIVMTWPTKEN